MRSDRPWRRSKSWAGFSQRGIWVHCGLQGFWRRLAWAIGEDSIVVGMNRFATDEPAEIDVLQIDADVERRQIERVQAVRASRSQGDWTAAIDAVAAAARGGENLVPPIIRAVEARATVGEISDAMRGEFGEHEEIDV